MPFTFLRSCGLLVIATVVCSAPAVGAQSHAPSNSGERAEKRADWRGISVRSEARWVEADNRLDRQLYVETFRNFQDAKYGNEEVTGSIVVLQKGLRVLKPATSRSLNSVHELSHQASGLGQEASTFSSRIKAA